MTARTFIFREEWLDFLADLNEKSQDKVFRAVRCYAFEREMPQLSVAESIAFNFIKASVDRDMEKYEERRLKNRENGKKGGRPRAEKTQNNPEKPFGFENNQMVSGENQMVSEVSRSVCNPIPIPISSNPVKGVTTSSPSQGDGEVSEEEKEEILSEFFFRNMAAPEKEVQEFLAYNNTEGRCWAKMSRARRRESVEGWQQKPERPPRFQADFLAMWKQLFGVLARAPDEIRLAALSDKIKFLSTKERLYVSVPDQSLPNYINEHVDETAPVMRPYLNKKHLKEIKYLIE